MSSNGQCKTCEKQFVSSDAKIACSDCDGNYHTGKCSGISDKTIKTKGEAYRLAWRCPACRRLKSCAQARDPTLSDDLETHDVRQMLRVINEKLDQLLPLREVVEGIEDSMQFWSEQYDELRERTEQNEKDIKDLKRRMEKLEAQDVEVNQMQCEIDNLEWRSRRLNLEFHGIQVTEKENLLSKLNVLATQLELPQLSDMDVVSIHRLPSRKDKTPGVICRFARQADRDRWWESRKKLRDSNDTLFLLENLTRRSRSLLFETKAWAKRNNYKYAWHSNGRVLVRKSDGSRAVVISNIADLDKLR
ncbi:uncharacterized protein ISCGN_000270 [Ixodes scapularis]